MVPIKTPEWDWIGNPVLLFPEFCPLNAVHLVYNSYVQTFTITRSASFASPTIGLALGEPDSPDITLSLSLPPLLYSCQVQELSCPPSWCLLGPPEQSPWLCLSLLWVLLLYNEVLYSERDFHSPILGRCCRG